MIPAEERGKARGKGAETGNDCRLGGGRTASPPACLSPLCITPLPAAFQANASLDGVQHLLLRDRLPAWAALGADKALLHAIKHGVKAPMHSFPAPQNQPPPPHQVSALQETLQEYVEQGAVRPLSPEEFARTRYWVPIFGREKKEGSLRLITNLRRLNACAAVPHHRTTTWTTVRQQLANRNLTWGLTIDLKSYYHNLAVHPKTRRWMRIQLRGQGYEMTALPFGWSLSPLWAHLLARPIRAWLNCQGIPFLWWVDDILILGSSQLQCETRAAAFLNQLTVLGLKANIPKSMQQASQTFSFLGHIFNLAEGRIHPEGAKNEACLRMVRHQLKATTATPRHQARLAGVLLDMMKSNVRLRSLPQQIMALMSKGLRSSAAALNLPHHHPKVWGKSIPKHPLLRNVLLQVKHALLNPIPVCLRPTNPLLYRLRTDSSDLGWGAQLCRRTQPGSWQEVATAAARWGPAMRGRHITHKEALASALGVSHCIRHIPDHCTLLLQSDASSTVWCWKKGTKNPFIHQCIQGAFVSLAEKGVIVQAEHLPGWLNRRADWLSRNADPKNYQLHPAVFREVVQHFDFHPEVDLFASRDNHQLPLYHSWRSDPRSLGNAWSTDWTRPCWANPPWELIPAMLMKLERDKVPALVCLPFWRSAHWWGHMTRLQQAPLLILRHLPLFRSPAGERLPPPRWATLFTVLRG